MKRIERIRTDFFPPAADRRAEGESESVPIRSIRFIRFTILPLYAEGVKARSAQNVVPVVSSW